MHVKFRAALNQISDAEYDKSLILSKFIQYLIWIFHNSVFFVVAHLHIETKLFYFKPKFHIFNDGEISWGNKQKRWYSVPKKHPTG